MHNDDKDDLAYALDVLQLTASETEDQLEDRLRKEACALGLQIEVHPQELADSPFDSKTPIPSSLQCSQSISSTGSRATTAASTASIRSTSRPLESPRSIPLLSHTSNLLRDAYGSEVQPERHSIAGLPTSSGQVLSDAHRLPQASIRTEPQKRTFCRLRGWSMLRSQRAEPSQSLSLNCPHCPRDAASMRRAVHSLPCGHRMCTQGLRELGGLRGKRDHTVKAQCCGVPIPDALLQFGLPYGQQVRAQDGNEHSDETASTTPSSPTTPSRASVMSQAQCSLVKSSSSISSASRNDSLAPRGQHADDDDGDAVSPISMSPIALTPAQQAQLDRFDAYAEARRTALYDRRSTSADALRSSHTEDLAALSLAHANALSAADDHQVCAEASLRAQHARDDRDLATALSHLRAHCDGTYRDGTPHGREISSQAKEELSKTQRKLDGMDRRLEARVNVLRGEQEKRARERERRQEREEMDLKQGQEREILSVEQEFKAAERVLEMELSLKRKRIRWRWMLELEILRRRELDEGGGCGYAHSIVVTAGREEVVP